MFQINKDQKDSSDREVLLHQLVWFLMLWELEVVDPEFITRYNEARASCASSHCDLIYLDLQFLMHVLCLFREGIISTVAELRSQAEQMVDYPQDEMVVALNEHIASVQKSVGI